MSEDVALTLRQEFPAPVLQQLSLLVAPEGTSLGAKTRMFSEDDPGEWIADGPR